MNYLISIFVFFLLQDIPLKPKEEFEVKLDYSFRQRPVGDHNTVKLGEVPKAYSHKSSTSVLPYLILHVKMLRLPEEKMRVRITTNQHDRSVVRKVSLNTLLELDMGFTDDMIDRVTPHEYTLTTLGSDKEAIDRIVITVAEDGTFLINGETRGKF